MAKPVFATNDVPTAAQFNDWFVNVLYARKASNESVASSTTNHNDTDLFFTVSANAHYHVSAVFLVSSPTAADAKIDFGVPSGAAFNYTIVTLTTPAAGYADDSTFVGVAGTNSGVGGLGGIGTVPVLIEGILIVAGTAGTFQLQWSQLTSNVGGTTFLANSYMIARRVS